MNVPKLRFKGFSDEWQQARLGEVTSSVMYGIGAAATIFNGIEKYLRITDIDENTRAFAPNPLTSPLGNIDKKYRLAKGDIVFARTGASVGKTYLYRETDGHIVFAGFLVKFSITKANSYFVYSQTLTESYRGWVKVMSMRSGQPGVNAEEYKEFEFLIPSEPEQTKIASFLIAMDDKISQLNEKCNLLRQYKKGVMQQIFSQELRFKDDAGQDFPEWEYLLANRIFANKTDKNHSGELPILAAMQDRGMIFREDSGLDIKSTDASVRSYKIVDKGDFVISLRSFQGGIEYSTLRGICSPAYTVLTPKIAIVDVFYRAYLKKEDFIERLSGTVIGIRDGKQISYSAFSGLFLPYPSIKEQTKIANFLSALDAQINDAQAALGLTQAFKKGLLQQMFV